MFLWIGLEANPEFVQKVFGVPSAIQVDIEKVALPEFDNPLSVAVRTIIEEIRIQRHKCMRVIIVFIFCRRMTSLIYLFIVFS